MSVTSVINTLQALHATVTGVVSAPTAMPASLNTADMPIVLTFPAECTWGMLTAGSLRRQDRVYKVRCYVAPSVQGAGVDEGYQQCLPIIQAMAEAYLAAMAWTTSTATVFINSVQDMGLDGQLMFAGTAYRGFEFRLTVSEKW